MYGRPLYLVGTRPDSVDRKVMCSFRSSFLAAVKFKTSRTFHQLELARGTSHMEQSLTNYGQWTPLAACTRIPWPDSPLFTYRCGTGCETSPTRARNCSEWRRGPTSSAKFYGPSLGASDSARHALPARALSRRKRRSGGLIAAFITRALALSHLDKAQAGFVQTDRRFYRDSEANV